MKATLVMSTFAVSVLSLSTAMASPVWVGNKELSAPKDSTQLTIMTNPFDGEVTMKPISSCTLIIPKKSYERKLKQGSEFSVDSVNTVLLPEPTLETLKKEAKRMFNIDISDKVKSVPELKAMIRDEFHATIIDNSNSTNFELKLRSLKSQNVYTMKCEVQQAGATINELGDMLVNFGVISPAREL